MAVSSEVSRNDYVGNNSTPTYSFTFLVTKKTDLQVIERNASDIEIVHVQDTDYTVVLNADLLGGTITLTAGNLTTGHALTIKRHIPLTTDLSIQNQRDYYPNVIQAQVDRSVLIDQQQQDELNRAIKLAPTQSPVDFNPVLPTLTDANRMLQINNTGTAFALGPTPQELSDAAAAVSGSLQSAVDAAASAVQSATSATASAGSATTSQNHRITAERFASQAAGTVIDAVTSVDSGEYSAKKHAVDAAASAVAADASADAAAVSAADAAQSAIDAASAAGGGISSLSGHVVAAGPGAAAATIQAGVVTSAMLATALSNTIAGKSEQLNDTGSGESIIGSAATAKVKKLIAGTGVTLTPGTDGITIDSSGGGVTDHGALTGLSDDDHTQYHNDTRGDARYYTKAQVDTSLGTKSATLNDTGAGQSIVGDAATGKVKKLIAGSNITLTPGTDGVTIASSGGGGGGSTARTALDAGTANRVVVNDGAGLMTDAAAITASRALISDANGIPTHSAVTSTVLGYLDATSSVQTQLNAKSPLIIDSGSGSTLIESQATGQIKKLIAGTNITLTPSTNGLTIASSGGGGGAGAFRAVSSYPDAIGTGDSTLGLTGSSGTVTLPTAVGVSGKTYTLIHNSTSLTSVFTIATTSSQTIGGVAGGSYALYTNGESLTVVSDGANWLIADHRAATSEADAGPAWITTSSAYAFTITAATIAAGTVYSNAGQTFIVSTSIAGAASLSAFGTGAPAASGTLTYVSGPTAGDRAFTAVSSAGAYIKPTGVTLDRFIWYRSGQYCYYRWEASFTNNGTTGTGQAALVLPPGLTCDTTLVTPYTAVLGVAYPTAYSHLGSGQAFMGGTNVSGLHMYASWPRLIQGFVPGTGAWGSAAPFNTTPRWSVSGRYPVVGWQP